MTTLTVRQEQVFDLIKRYIDDSGYPPTRADIAREFGFKSPNAAEEHLRSLQKKGLIEIVPGTSRGIRINQDQGLAVYSVKKSNAKAQPVCIGRCQIDPQFFSPSADYLLQLENHGFIDLNLTKGDLLAVKKTNKGSSQDLVIGALDGQLRLGILKKTRSKYRLKLLTGEKRTPEIEINLRQQVWKMKGKVVGSIRRNL